VTTGDDACARHPRVALDAMGPRSVDTPSDDDRSESERSEVEAHRGGHACAAERANASSGVPGRCL